MGTQQREWVLEGRHLVAVRCRDWRQLAAGERCGGRRQQAPAKRCRDWRQLATV